MIKWVILVSLLHPEASITDPEPETIIRAYGADSLSACLMVEEVLAETPSVLNSTGCYEVDAAFNDQGDLFYER